MKPTDLIQGMLDLLILRTLQLEPLHGWADGAADQQISNDVLQVQQGSLYPALHRLEAKGWITAEWGASDKGKRAKFYSADCRRPETTRARAAGLGASLPGHRPGPEKGLRIPHELVRCVPIPCARLAARIAGCEFDDEVSFHMDQLAAEDEARGLSPADARAAARRDFGIAATVKEDLRAARGVHLIDAFFQDVRHGMRQLRRHPGFAAAALLTIALGIGATTTVFTVVYNVILRPLPYPQPERLVTLWSTAPALDLPRAFVGAANYRDWLSRNRSFEGLALVRHIGNFNLTGAGEPERLQGARVTASLFTVLGTYPVSGGRSRHRRNWSGATPWYPQRPPVGAAIRPRSGGHRAQDRPERRAARDRRHHAAIVLLSVA